MIIDHPLEAKNQLVGQRSRPLAAFKVDHCLLFELSVAGLKLLDEGLSLLQLLSQLRVARLHFLIALLVENCLRFQLHSSEFDLLSQPQHLMCSLWYQRIIGQHLHSRDAGTWHTVYI